MQRSPPSTVDARVVARRSSALWSLAVVLAACHRIVGDPSVIPSIEAWNQDLELRDLELKYCKMVASPFSFFRGTDHLFWADLGTDPRLALYGTEPSWVQGDAHVLNFGAFDDNRGDVVYDLNDFDESVLADVQLDVWRFAASIVLMGEDEGLPPDDIDAGIEAFTEAWLDTLDDLVDSDAETRATFTEDTTTGLLSSFLDDVEDDNDRVDLLARWTLDDELGDRRFDTSLDDLDVLSDPERDFLLAGMSGYVAGLDTDLAEVAGYFEIIDGARRRDAGLGSLGTPRYYLRIEGPGPDADDDHILDVKRQAAPSASMANAAWADPAPCADHAARVAKAQKALAVHVDDALGTLVGADGPYTVRDMSPYKEAFPLEELRGHPKRLEVLARQWGMILAYAHARADDDHDETLVPGSIEAAVTAVADHHHEVFGDQVKEVALAWASHMVDGHAAFVPWVEDTYGFDCPE